MSLETLPDFVPGNAQSIWIKPSDVIPRILEQAGPLSADEIELVQKICSKSEHRYFIDLGVYLDSKIDYGLSYPYVKVRELEDLLQKTIRELGKLKPNDEVFLTLDRTGDYDDYSYRFSFNIPSSEDYINEKVVKIAINNIQSLRSIKEKDEERRREREKEAEITKEKELELGRLITLLQSGGITAEEFKTKSDAIYNKK